MLQHALPFQCLDEGFQLCIPSLAEAANQRIAQEAIDGHFQFAAFSHGAFADFPAMIVERNGAVAQPLLADGVEIAADGLRPGCSPVAEGFL